MGVDRWDGGMEDSGWPVLPAPCVPQAASAGVILSALPAWLSVWQMRAVGCHPQGLSYAWPCHSVAASVPLRLRREACALLLCPLWLQPCPSCQPFSPQRLEFRLTCFHVA